MFCIGAVEMTCVRPIGGTANKTCSRPCSYAPLHPSTLTCSFVMHDMFVTLGGAMKLFFVAIFLTWPNAQAQKKAHPRFDQNVDKSTCGVHITVISMLLGCPHADGIISLNTTLPKRNLALCHRSGLVSFVCLAWCMIFCGK